MRLGLAGLVLGFAIGLVACGDDSTGPDEDSLTRGASTASAVSPSSRRRCRARGSGRLPGAGARP